MNTNTCRDCCFPRRQERGQGRLRAGGRLILVRCGSRKVDRADGCSSADARVEHLA